MSVRRSGKSGRWARSALQGTSATKAASTRRSRTAAVSASFVPVMSSMRTAGYLRWYPASTGGSRLAVVLSRAPRRRTPCGVEPATAALASSASRSSLSAYASSSSPAGDRKRRLRSRTNSSVPRVSSSCFTRVVTFEGTRCSLRAALRTPPSSTTALKIWSWARSIVIPFSRTPCSLLFTILWQSASLASVHDGAHCSRRTRGPRVRDGRWTVRLHAALAAHARGRHAHPRAGRHARSGELPRVPRRRRSLHGAEPVSGAVRAARARRGRGVHRRDGNDGVVPALDRAAVPRGRRECVGPGGSLGVDTAAPRGERPRRLGRPGLLRRRHRDCLVRAGRSRVGRPEDLSGHDMAGSRRGLVGRRDPLLEHARNGAAGGGGSARHGGAPPPHPATRARLLRVRVRLHRPRDGPAPRPPARRFPLPPVFPAVAPAL